MNTNGLSVRSRFTETKVANNELYDNFVGIRLGEGTLQNPETITDNLVERNHATTSGISGISLRGADDNRITGNVVTTSSGEAGGIDLRNGSDDNVLSRNESDHNVDLGIFIDSSSNRTLVDRNETNFNGLRSLEAGIRTLNPSTKLKKNSADYNGGLGIDAPFGAIDGGRNEADHNGNPLQCSPSIDCD